MGRGGDTGPATAVFGMCAFVWVIVSAFLLGFSFDTLDPNTMALLMNDNTLFLDKSTLYNGEPAESGRWFTGLGQQFLEFPRSLIKVKFNEEEDADAGLLSAKTHNGTTITMGVAFQYGIKRTAANVYNMYMMFGEEYTPFLVKSTRQVVRDVISDHAVSDLWTQRAAITAKIKAALSIVFEARHCYIANFQLLSLDIPRDIQDAIETTSVAFQRISEARFEKDAETVRARTRRLVAEKTAEVTVLEAEATAEALLLVRRDGLPLLALIPCVPQSANAAATALNMTTNAEVLAYKSIKGTFGFNTSRLLTYVWLDNMLANSAGSAMISVQQPAITRFTS